MVIKTKFCIALAFSISMVFAFNYSHAQETPYEKNGKNYTATYAECIAYYKALDKKYDCVKMSTWGETDSGIPLHLVTLSRDAKHQADAWHAKNKIVIFINNGIHPGEPDGIDASMMLVRDLAKSIENNETDLSDNIALAIIPMYNIGGALLRSEFNRPDQNGPVSFGARGNAQNLDLNRDFIKSDSKEAKSFAQIFHWLRPEIFIDNHVSDGADYQHIITLATTQSQKLGNEMGAYLNEKFEPALFRDMQQKNYPMIPYVNAWDKDARTGWTQFFDSPRYSSGYAAMFHTFAFTIETHMLKPYPQRVDATYQLMKSIMQYASTHHDEISDMRKKSQVACLKQSMFPLNWQADERRYSEINFNGYVYKERKSEVSGLPVHYYDHSEPYTEQIKFYNYFIPSTSVIAPNGYIIPKSWWKVIELLAINQVEMKVLEDTATIEAEVYKIVDYKSAPKAYEGHHLNSSVQVEKSIQTIPVEAGDIYIPLDQAARRFIIEVLEPQGNDSYFAWNYFDPILVQKEGYSDYSFEEIASNYLKENPNVKVDLVQKRNADTSFANSASKQLEFVYQHSPYPETRFNVYPIYRIVDKTQEGQLPLSNFENQVSKNKEDE